MSVFVVLKYARRVKLDLYHQGAPVAVVQSEANTVALGQFLHALVVTAQLTGDLILNEVYEYNLTFTSISAPGDTEPSPATLQSLGLLQAPVPLGYAQDALPSFKFPPVDVADLRLVHASCRLPHAKGPDALQALDSILLAAHAGQMLRPHQLFLTGDQIYADDVHPAMLRMVSEVGHRGLGWIERERMPDVLDTGNGTADTEHFSLAPGRRMLLLQRRAHITSVHARSHLVSLAEFLGMYLLIWSPSLWPRDSAQNVHPPTETETFHHPDWQWAEVDELIAAERRDAAEGFGDGRLSLMRFGGGLHRVRRALANIPSYMAFDDHEFTDDWNLHQQWSTDVNGSPLGARIRDNALSAFGIFQAWGNTPTQYAGNEPGAKLLAAIGRWHGEMDHEAELDRTLQLADMQWHYDVSFPAHRLLVLDTRTHRGFEPTGSSRQAAQLIEIGSMDGQLAPPQQGDAALTIVVSPAPVIGHPFVEEGIQPTFRVIFDLSLPARIMIWPEAQRGREEVDWEAWCFHPQALQQLLERLAARKNVLILSGDVHYGFSAAIEYWDQRGGGLRTSAIAQLTSSGLRNEDAKTKFIGGKTPKDHSYLGWELPGRWIVRTVGGFPTDGPVLGTPAMLRVPAHVLRLIKQPDWRYRIRFARDARLESVRGTLDDVTAGLSELEPTGPLSAEDRLATLHRLVSKYERMRSVVGHNNLAEIQFDWSASAKRVIQRFWFIPLDSYEKRIGQGDETVAWDLSPYTEHEIPFDAPDGLTGAPTEHAP